ncbi:hypothetical protein ACHWQZ_G004583 [Mnemiopsis leidyi]
MNKQLLVVIALVGIAGAYQCTKRETGQYKYVTSAEGWDHCDSNGLACCYYINGTVIIFSHGYNNGSYNPNTHCEYVIDLDPECDIVVCASMDFSMNGNDMVSIQTMDMNIKWTGNKKPFNSRVHGHKASIRFTSGPDAPPEGSKWSMGIVCVPKTEYKSVCEVCDEIAEQQGNGPDGDNILQPIN